MIAMWTVSALTAVATVFAPLAGSPPSTATCSGHLAYMMTARCSKEPLPKSHEKFRRALTSYILESNDVFGSVGKAMSDLQGIMIQCKNENPVDPLAVDNAVSRMRQGTGGPMVRAGQALSVMNPRLVDKVFAGSDTKLARIDAVVKGLQTNLEDINKTIENLAQAGALLTSGSCDGAELLISQAADSQYTTGEIDVDGRVTLSRWLLAAEPPCKSGTVKAPYSDKALRKAAGSKGSKTATAGDMSMDYPTSLDVGGKRVFLPVNLNSSAPSGYVQLEFTQGSKALVALSGGTPAGQSGLRIKVLGKARPGKGKLRLTFSPAGGAEVTKVVKIKLT